MKAAIFGSKRDPHIKEKIKMISKSLKDFNVVCDTTYFDKSVEYFKSDPDYIYNVMRKALQKSDVVIVENTLFNTGISLIIGRVIELNKPVLVLVDSSEEKAIDTPAVLKAHSAKMQKVFYIEYNKDTLDEILREFVKNSKDLLNTKFLFNFSPDMAKYLQWSSEYYNRPMVDVLRELIGLKMDSDKKWQKYLEE